MVCLPQILNAPRLLRARSPPVDPGVMIYYPVFGAFPSFYGGSMDDYLRDSVSIRKDVEGLSNTYRRNLYHNIRYHSVDTSFEAYVLLGLSRGYMCRGLIYPGSQVSSTSYPHPLPFPSCDAPPSSGTANGRVWLLSRACGLLHQYSQVYKKKM